MNEDVNGAPPAHNVSPWLAGVTGRCPRCGKGHLFKRGLEFDRECASCGLGYGFLDTGDGPAIFAIMILGFVRSGGALYVEFAFLPPVWVHVVLWGILTPLLSFALLRLLKGTLAALQFANKAEEGRLE